jgi:hypothetical protein
MSTVQIIIFGCLFFALAITAFILTILEFIKMDKTPGTYINPRYKTLPKKRAPSKRKKTSAKKRPTIAKKTSPAKTTTKKSSRTSSPTTSRKASPKKSG